MNKQINFLIILFLLLSACLPVKAKIMKMKFEEGMITVKHVAKNAVRIQYTEGKVSDTLPEWIYVRNEEVDDCSLTVKVDKKRHTLYIIVPRVIFFCRGLPYGWPCSSVVLRCFFGISSVIHRRNTEETPKKHRRNEGAGGEQAALFGKCCIFASVF